MKSILDSLKALGTGRLVAMGAVALGVLILFLVLALRGGNPRMGLLYGDLDLREAAQMAETLARQHIAYQLGGGGNEILVPVEQIAQARMLLAHDGLPTGGSIGYEIFDRGDGLLANQFTQNINQTRALEGELARTIQTIHGVRGARVHLVLPHREPFARTQQDAQASVLLNLAGNNRLDREEVQAILNLVAAAVPGLRPENIALTDTRGTLLARAGQPAESLAATTLAEMQNDAEQHLDRAVEEMLQRSLGAGHVEAQAAIEMDFDQIQETQERYDPDGQVVRSTQSVTDNTKSSEAAPTTSVQNNLPNAPDTGSSGTGSQEQRQEDTTNYEIGKTVRKVIHERPQIRRISLAVLVDGVEERDAKGAAHWRARTPDELARISALVRSAIGYDEKRGDHVEVVNMPFAHDDLPNAEAPLLGMHFEQADVLRLAQTGLIGLLGLAALAFVLRPTVLRLARLSGIETAGAPFALSGAAAGGAAALAGAPGMAEAGGALLASAAGVPRLAGPAAAGGALLGGGPSEDDEMMVAIANVEGNLRASSIRRVAELVDKHPEESLTIVRTWMQESS